MIYRALFLLLAASTFVACERENAESAPAPPAPAAPAGEDAPLPEDVKEALAAVAADPAAPAEDASILVETGELVSPIRSELSPRFPGRVGKILVDEGARVRKGQPLLELETEYLKLEADRDEAALARARAAADEAGRDFRRKEELLAKGSVSQALHDRTRATLDQAEAAAAEAEAELALAKQRLDDAALRSPIDGIVAERRTDVGERLGESSVAFVLVQVSPLKLRFRLPERYLASVEKGQTVRARVDPYPGEVFEGRVTAVVRAVDAATRSFVVEAVIENRDERLKPGLFARVELELAPRPSS